MPHHLIIGSSAASIAVINKLSQLQPDAKITCITAEHELPYNKCLLADYVAGGKQVHEIALALARNPNITFIPGLRVTTLDAAQKKVICADGKSFAYDTLFLGTGSSPYIPDFACNSWYPGVFTFHTLADSNQILAYVRQKSITRALIVGAGLSGIECADALNKNGVRVTIVEKSDQIGAQLLDADAAQWLQRLIEATGNTVLCSATIASLYGDYSQGVTGALCSQGSKIEAHLVIIATGLRSNSVLAQQAGMSCGQAGIIVDEAMQTSVPAIYAAGDTIAVKNLLTGHIQASCTWPDAMLQGMHAAYAMAGQPRAYAGASIIVSSAFFDKNMAQAGLLYPQDGQDQIVIKRGANHYHRFIMREHKLRGFSVLGNVHNLGLLRRAILTGQSLDF